MKKGFVGGERGCSAAFCVRSSEVREEAEAVAEDAAEGVDGPRRKQMKPMASRAARSRVMGFVRRIERATAIAWPVSPN